MFCTKSTSKDGSGLPEEHVYCVDSSFSLSEVYESLVLRKDLGICILNNTETIASFSNPNPKWFYDIGVWKPLIWIKKREEVETVYDY